MTELLLVRHGETDWNRERRFQGHADPPLNETGLAQARMLAEELAHWSPAVVYTSDLKRARETAAIAAGHARVPLVELEELREIDVGEWEGLTWPQIEKRHPDGARRWHEDGHGWEGGETHDEFQDRVLRALRLIAARHPRQRVAVVVHGGTLRSVAAALDGRSVVEHRRQAPPFQNCDSIRIAFEDGFFRRLD